MAQPKDSDKGFVPFDVGRAGATASVEVNVSWLSRKQPREVALMIKPPKEGWSLPDGTYLGHKYADLMESLTGLRTDEVQANTRIPKPHKGITFHVVWQEKESGKILREETVTRDDYHGRVKVGFGYAFTLSNRMFLTPGKYVVTVTALEDDTRFDGTFRTGLVAGYHS